MLRTYPLKMFTSYCFSMNILKCKFIPKGMAGQLPHLITGRNVKDLSPENCFSTKIV